MKEHQRLLRGGSEMHADSFLTRITTHLRTLSLSDKVVVAVLSLIVVISGLSSLYTLEKQFLVEVPSYGGSLLEGSVGTPRFVNPLLAISDTDKDLATLTYAGLMGYDHKGELTPALAERYEISEDGKVYTFTLREHIRFSDGSPVTAEDVVFTIKKAQDPSLKSPELSNWSNILVEAVDARTVRFSLPKAYAPFLSDATLGILPAHIWREVSNEEFPFVGEMLEPVGAGPYEVKNVVHGKNGIIERYELVAFSDYALGKPYLSKIAFMFFKTEEELKNAVVRGRVESAHSAFSKDALHASYSRVFGVFFNQNLNPLFARIEVRKALSQALNRDELVENTLGGFATAVYGPVPLGSTMLRETPIGDTGIEAARQTLQDGGWEYSDETKTWVHADEGLTLSVSIKTSNVPELKAVAQKVQEDWQALGVSTTVEFFEPSTLSSEVIRPRNYDALLFGMVIGRDNDLFAFWESSQRNDPGLNIAMYANKRVDDLLENIRTETDPEVRSENLAEVNELIAKDYPAVFTHAPDFVYTVPKDLEGIVLGTIASPKDRFATLPFWYRHTEWVWPFLKDEKATDMSN